jgi:hypothetical protein
MIVEIKQTDKNKWQLLGTFEIANSGVIEQRILVSNLSLKKAKELQVKFNTGKV